MKKFYQKKDIPTEESPILLQLQRRHTIMEVDNETVSTDKKVCPFSRSNSTSSLVDKMQSISSRADTQNKPADTAVSPDTSSSISNASTVVITESELSSSWLYKKAQMNTNETVSTCDSTAQLNPIKEETKQSAQPRPNVKSTSPASGRAEKPSSCCCYALVILIITLSSLGILSAIGSILYMEFFAVYSNNDNQTTVQSTVSGRPRIPYPDDFYPMRKIGLSFDEDDNQTVTGHVILSDEDSTSKNERFELQSNSTSEKSDFTNEEFGTQKVNEESNGTEDFSDKKKIETDTHRKDITAIDIIANKEDWLSNNHSTSNDGAKNQMLNKDTPKKESNQSETLHPMNTVLLLNEKEESPYSKLFELYREHHETDSKNPGNSEKSSNSALNQNQPVFESHDSTLSNLNTLRDNDSNFIQELEQEKEEKLDHGTERSDSNFGFKDEIDFELNDEIETNNVTELSKSQPLNPQQTLENGNLEFSSKDTLKSEHGKTTEVHDSSEKIPQLILESLPQIPEEENLGISNSFRTLDVDFESDNVHTEQNSKAPELNEPFEWNRPVLQSTNITNLFPTSLFQVPKDERLTNSFRTMNVDSEENPGEQNLRIPDLNEPLAWNRPILEANVAVPGPIEVIRRLNLGKDSATRNEQSSADLSDHDMRFSLAKALERLRLLDTNNILSSSRQKISDISKKASQKKSVEPKIQSEIEVGAERSRYLKNLRKKFFDK